MYELIRDIEDFEKIVIDLSKPVFCDTETCIEEGKSDGGLYGRVRLFQVFQSGWGKAVIIDCFFIPLQKVLSLIVDSHCVFHGGNYDLHTINLYTEEVWLPKKMDDTLYLSRLAFGEKAKFSFYDCLKYAGMSDDLIEGIDKKEAQKSNWSGALSQEQKTYAAVDVFYLERLYNVVKNKSSEMVYSLDIVNLRHAIKFCRNGMPVNRDTVKKLKKEYLNKLESVLDELPINPRSSKQSCEYLGTSSSAAEVLEELVQDGDEKAQQISNARHYAKSLEYLNAYDRDVIKGFINPCAALSGRFSCSGGNRFGFVNLQQIPNGLHKVVEAPPGYTLVYKDYSGLELRMAVAYTGEEVMGKMMKSGQDMHAETAKFIFEKEEITQDERTIAKTFNFGLIYGAGVRTVKQTLKLRAGVDLPFQKVKELMQKWFDMYDGFSQWHEHNKKQYDIYGYVDVETALGRKVRTYRLTDSLNLPIQGSSVEVTKVSLGMLFRHFPDAHLVNTIHDSNILMIREEDAEKWGKRLSSCMVDAWKFVTKDMVDPDIPMPHGFETGKIWDF